MAVQYETWLHRSIKKKITISDCLILPQSEQAPK